MMIMRICLYFVESVLKCILIMRCGAFGGLIFLPGCGHHVCFNVTVIFSDCKTSANGNCANILRI